MLTQRLFAHASKKHNMSLNEYQQTYNIPEQQIRKECYAYAKDIHRARRQQQQNPKLIK